LLLQSKQMKWNLCPPCFHLKRESNYHDSHRERSSMTNLTTPLPSELKRHLLSSCEPGSFVFRTQALRPSLPSSHPSCIAFAFCPCALIISCVWVLSVGEELLGFVDFLVCNGLAPLHRCHKQSSDLCHYVAKREVACEVKEAFLG